MDGLFVNWGGDATSRSYGIGADFTDGVRLARTHSELVQAVPVAHTSFLRSLGFSASFGEFFFCHAGIQPASRSKRNRRTISFGSATDFLGTLELHLKAPCVDGTRQRAEVMAETV